MLRVLSEAAVESRSTGSLSSHSTGSLIDEEEGTESEDEKIGSCWRFALCIGYWIPTWGHLSLANVGRSSSAGALALFHCYLFLAGGTLIFINCCSALLRFYMGWFVKGSVHLEDFRDCCKFRQILDNSVDFMGLFLRSCIVMQVTSDILRFTYLLGIDAWRPDAFEAYRRLVVFDARHELDAGEFYIRPWSTSLRPWQKAGDVIFQLLLHTSLNLIPITALILSAIGLANKVMVCKLCLVIGTIHILVFYFCFAFGEMWLKLQSFREAWALARRSEGMAPFQRRDCTWARSTVRRISQATENRSICVLCCTIFEWLQAVMPSWLGIGVAIAGVSFHRPALIVVGSVWTGLLLFTTVLTLPRWGQVPMVGSSWITHYFPRPEILQDWGENWCNLGIHAQVRQRYHAALMLALCAVIFGAFRFHSLTLVCLALLSILFSRIMWLRLEGKLGWLYAFMEWLIATICLIAVIMASSPRNPFDRLFLFMCLAGLLHFGYTRGIPAGERVRISSEIILGFVAMLFLALTCSALLSFSEDQQWSAFGPAMNKTRFLEIATAPSNPVLPERPLCLVRFNYGPGVLRDARQLSVTEFALMASLTYEMPQRVVEACSHYFPKWRVEGRPENARKKDWASFLMLTSEDNSTTVIAVRGTLDFLDVLADVALWLVPALMQVLNLIGPDISSGNWGKAISEYAELLPVASVGPDQTFSSVLAATEFMMESHPGRRFFLTGHSLGGGIAKLVALQLPVQSRPMTIAFAAPGVQYSARVLLGHTSRDRNIQLRKRLDMEDEFTLDVIPRHDVVSQLDWTPSSALIAPCDGQPWECHSIFRVIWGIFSTCGSMTLDNLMVPCEPFGKCA